MSKLTLMAFIVLSGLKSSLRCPVPYAMPPRAQVVYMMNVS